MNFKMLADLLVFVNGFTREEALQQVKFFYNQDAEEEIEFYRTMK
ncbi:hypothetical protein PQR01_00270 [Paraburkholderia rhynchosiae]|uniref:Uncharacterized protein n=1 Tax=Paraburkholderia rhynchosiae TaxID=487049 RepID=A0ACC7N5J6_9BURK